MSSPSAPSTSRLDGKIALVTGSGRGMGRQNALELASRGASLVINYSRAADAAQAVVREIEALGSRAIAIAADMSKPAEVAMLFEKAVSHYGKLDIVVSNSGVESFGHISEVTVEEFDRVFSVNTRGQLLVAQQAYKHLQEGGRLVGTCSNACSLLLDSREPHDVVGEQMTCFSLCIGSKCKLRSNADFTISTGHAEQYQCIGQGHRKS